MQKAVYFYRLALSLVFMLASLTVPQVSYAAQVGTVQGVVRGDSGQPLQGARVTLQGTGGGQKTTSDKSGYYSFAGVQPGTYTVVVGLVTYDSSSIPVTVAADVTQNVDFALAKRVITGSRIVRIAPTRRNDTTTSTRITAVDEQREKSQPNVLYQSIGLMQYKPGVTTDSGQYPHLRGADGNQVQWMVDGINVRDPITNQFATNLVTVGIRSSNLVTGGATADYGGATGGFLNQITANGRDIAPGRELGGFIENTNSPGRWKYEGGTTQIGGVLFNNKFDYALSSVLFKSHYPDNTQLDNLASSHDESAKFNYYADPNNTFTLYFTHGAENYNFYQLDSSGTKISNTTFFDPDRTLTDPVTGRKFYSFRDLSSDFQDHSVQTHNLDHFTFKHNFTSGSYLQYRIYQLHQATPNHSEGVGGLFGFDRTNVTGNQLDYSNQLSRQNIVRAGLEYLDAKGTYRRQILTNVPLVSGAAYSDRNYSAYPKDFSLYLADSLRSADNKATLDLGLRFNSTTFNSPQSKYALSQGLASPSSYTTKSTDPRIGLNYSPDPNLTFRTSYSVTSQHPDTRRINRLAPFDVGSIETNLKTDPLAQSKADFLTQGFSRVALSHSKDYDLGFEKAFTVGGLANGQYSLGVTGFKKREYDNTYESLANYDPNNGPTTPINYNNDGTSHASGLEVAFRKLQRKPSDWNGYVSYTNEVVRTNTSLYDTTYVPYFSAFFAGNSSFADSATTPYGTILADGTAFGPNRDLRLLNHREFAAGWDQRHTVGVVVNKRISKLLETSVILDAGSGLPYFAGGAADGTIGTVGPGFGELSGSLSGSGAPGGTADFTEVPVVLPNGKLPSINPVQGYTGWHYKFSLNSNINISDTFSFFVNADNIFDRKTVLALSTATFSGVPYFEAPSPQYPQGRNVYQPQARLTPIFLTFGFRQKF